MAVGERALQTLARKLAKDAVEVLALTLATWLCHPQLDLSSNKVVSLEGIQALQRLESLNLARNNLTNVDVLASLPSLRVVSVAENSIVQLDGLSKCPELLALDASYNNVTKWPRFEHVTTLEVCACRSLTLLRA